MLDNKYEVIYLNKTFLVYSHWKYLLLKDLNYCLGKGVYNLIFLNLVALLGLGLEWMDVYLLELTRA